MSRTNYTRTVSVAAIALMGSAISGAAIADGHGGASITGYSSVNAQLEAMDDNRDARITRAEAKDYYDDLYRKLARTDGDDGLSVEDLIEGPRKLAAKKHKEMEKKMRKRKKERFDSIDYNRDDMIDEGEYLDAPHLHHHGGMRARSETKALARFDAHDTNKDGLISYDEFMNGRHAKGDHHHRDDNAITARARAVHEMIDQNQDGNVSRIEFVNSQWANFNKTDQNHDDVLDRDEIRQSINLRANAKGGFMGMFRGRTSDNDAPLYTDMGAQSELDADIDAEMNTWRNPDER